MFASLCVLLYVAHLAADFWVNAAKAVSTFFGVSLKDRTWMPTRAGWWSMLSRLCGVNDSVQSSSLGMAGA
ncbi:MULTISPECIES: hypothetical protein [Streptomyces]|uniref:DUF3307 domain-containing protein n=1 Tax=Streptomyces canarius TaxID=285453 RepID=A0ABQ3DF37_9ACTN|nr:hypothetical protein [Streptomyces canarius]GHA73866.1 hypothetical protein GCM10010345_90690 [Streptomyces canarius]